MPFKIPPDPSLAKSYELWRKDVMVWQKITDIAKEKQGLVLQYACRGSRRIHEAIMNIEDAEVESENGFGNVLKVLDRLHNIDKKEAEMKTYHEFESVRREDGQTIADFINQFDALLTKTKSYGNTMSETLLASKLMRAANLTRSQQQIIKAATEDITYTTVMATMRRTFGESTLMNEGITNDVDKEGPVIKREPILQAAHKSSCDCLCDNQQNHQTQKDKEEGCDEVLYGYNRKFYHRFKGKTAMTEDVRKSQSLDAANFKVNQKKGRNRLDKQGKITRCYICESINHWAANCPDREDESKSEGVLHQVVLFQNELDDSNNIKTLTHETIGAAVADCGASKTVCGESWLTSYLQLLTPQEKEYVSFKKSNNTYKFGIGSCKAISSVKIPIKLGRKNVMLETDVVANELPLLLSKASMKRASAYLDTKNDVIHMLGEEIKLINTSSGHYAVPLCSNKATLNALITESNPNISLVVRTPNMTKKAMALKLHRQFVHPTAEKLLKLVNLSDQKDDYELKTEILEVTQSCDTCKRYKQAPPRPVVGLPQSTRFNEVVVIDIKFYEGTPLLHLIDSCTRFSASAVLRSKKAKEVVDNIFGMWISIFGCPQEFCSDNGGEFDNEQFRDMGDAMSIKVNTTGAYSPWANGLCERYNRVLGEMIDKILEEVDCSLKVAVAWATSAKNSLQNVHGFSPAQLVFGFNPVLPSVHTDKPPALSSNKYAEIVKDNLDAMKRGREAMIQSESSERIRRALNHNTRIYSDVKYINGDTVYYKRPDERRWRGPGKVIGQDGQFVLVRHGGGWVRVHPCRLQLTGGKHKESIQIENVEGDNPTKHEDWSEEENILAEDNSDLEEEVLDQPNDPVKNVIQVIPEEEPSRVQAKEEKSKDENKVKGEELGTQNRKPKNAYNKAVKFTDELKDGVAIKFKVGDEWITGTLAGRYRKVSGKTPNCWNVQVGGGIRYINFDEDVSAVEVINEESGEELLVSQVFAAEVTNQVRVAKEKELEMWKIKEVYREVENDGFDLVSIKWVIKPKIPRISWRTPSQNQVPLLLTLEKSFRDVK